MSTRSRTSSCAPCTASPSARPDPAPWREGLGRRLRARRLELGWSFSEASRRTGLARSFLCELESGVAAPSLYAALCIAEAYGLSLLYVAGAGAGEASLGAAYEEARRALNTLGRAMGRELGDG